MEISIRLAVSADIPACGRIMYEAFEDINKRHGFENIDVPSLEVGCGIAKFLILNSSYYGVVAAAEGHIVGSCFLDERNSIRAVDITSVEPSAQGQGVGRALMSAVLERSLGSRGVRLAQHTFNTASFALYASLGFEVKEPLMLVRGRPSGMPAEGIDIRPMRAEDLDACGALCEQIYGCERTNEVRDCLSACKPMVAVRTGRVVAYSSWPAEWSGNHGVAETEADMRALLLGMSASMAKPLCFLLPVRQTSFLHWCFEHGLRAIKPMTLMAMGEYREPAGCYFPSGGF